MKISISNTVQYSTRVVFADGGRPIFGERQTCYVEWRDEYKKRHFVALVAASHDDRLEFGRGVFRAGPGEMIAEFIMRIDPKGMKLYFVDNDYYEATDKVQWQEPIKLDRLVIFNRALFESAY